jgi:hypothetical protein
VTEELRGLLRDELAAERPPPLGDLVAAALRDGRRIRRRRRLAALGGGTAVAAVLAVTVGSGSPSGLLTTPLPAATAAAPADADGLPPAEAADLPPAPPAPPAAAAAKAPQARATPEAMLMLLEELLPPGRRSEHATTGQRDLHVQLYLDRGKGPGMIRVSVSGDPRPGPRTGTPVVSVDNRPGNCIQSTVVRAQWPGGLVVQADLATCLAWDGRRNKPAPQVLSGDEARSVVADPRWGPTMDAGLVRAGARQFPRVAYFS